MLYKISIPSIRTFILEVKNGQKTDIRGFWAGCSKTAEIIPSSTGNNRNKGERCTNAAARRADAFFWPNKFETESGLLLGFFPGKGIFLATFRTGFCWIVLASEENPIRNVAQDCTAQREKLVLEIPGEGAW